MASARRSPHTLRQKRQIRHMVASGGDMPPLGFRDRSSFFKGRNSATDEAAYWAGPVTERPQPWKHALSTEGLPQQGSADRQQSTRASSPQAHGLDRVPVSSADDRGVRACSSSSLSRKSFTRRRRPSSAANITVLSMLDFERKVQLQASSSAPRLRRKGTTRPSTAAPSTRRRHSQSASRLTPTANSTKDRLSRKSAKNASQKKNKKQDKMSLEDDSLASTLLSEGSVQEFSKRGGEDRNTRSPRNRKPKTETRSGSRNDGRPNYDTTSLEWATRFLGDVKDRLKHEPALFEEFIRSVEHGDGTIGSVLSVTRALLVGHEDLISSMENIARQRAFSNSNSDVELSQHGKRSSHTLKPSRKTNRRGQKRRGFTWLLDVAKTDAPVVLRRTTLERLSKAPVRYSINDNPAFVPIEPGKGATGRYQGSGGGRFSTAFPMSNLERTILDASRLPGPLDYQDPSKHHELPGGEFSTARPKSDVDWLIYHSKQRPGPSDYRPRLSRKKVGVKFSDANPKSYLDWAIYNAQQVPGPLRYDISKCMY